MEAIEVSGLVREFRGGLRAVDGIDLDVAAGEVYGFLGPNGAGKTTTVRILVTLLRPTAGHARVAGHDVAREPDRVRRRIGVALQEAALDPLMTGRELVELQAVLHGMGRRDRARRVRALLEQVGLSEAADRRVGTYSGGMKRRLDLAAALVHEPDVLFLDEPTTGLDPVSRMSLWEEVRRLRSQGRTIFLTTQYLEEADQLADRVGIIHRGALVAEGTPAELKAQVRHPHLHITLAEGGDAEVAGRVAGQFGAVEPLELPAGAIEPAALTLSVELPAGAAKVAAVVRALEDAGVGVASLDLVQPTLDDVFVAKTGRHLEGQAQGAPAEPAGVA